jgi:hypothetical protein
MEKERRMNAKSLMIAGAAVMSLAAPAAALADPVWNGDYQQGYYADHSYDVDHDRGDWNHADYDRDYYDRDYYGHPAYGWGYHRHCWTQVRPYRTSFGAIRYQRVTECRR